MFRAVVPSNNGSTTEQLNGRSLYPDVNRDGSKVVFESDSDLSGNSSGSEIFLWSLDANGIGSLEVITAGDGNSYNPSIDDDGKYVVFDSYAKNLQTQTNALADTNGLRDIFLLDLDQKITWRANLNYKGEEANGWSVSQSTDFRRW